MMIKERVKLLTGAVLTTLGVPRLLHSATLHDQLTIVTYHGVVREPLKVKYWCFIDEASFRDQILYLKRHFRVVKFSEGVELLQSGGIDRPTAVITFDDGFQNNHDVAFPILREAEVPAIIFLTTGFLNSDSTLWFCRLHSAIAQTKEPHFSLDGSVWQLGTSKLRAQASTRIRNSLKDLPGPELVLAVRRIGEKLGIDADGIIEPESPFRMLNYEAIERMLASRLVEFGAHTHSHPILSRLDSEQRRREIETSVEIVTKLLGRECEFFAYPNGDKPDYDADTIAMLRDCGIRAAATTVQGPNGAHSSLMELTRYGFGAGDTNADFALAVHHTKYLLKHAFKGLNKEIGRVISVERH
jgi:peptidoglycan/xylan/chitin deacetylase (PgdA/CDA1 family)